MFGSTRGGPNSLRPGFTGDGHVVAAPLTAGWHPGSNAPGRRKEDDENLVATPIDLRQASRTSGATGAGTPGTGIGEPGDPAYAVTEVTQCVAFSSKFSNQAALGNSLPDLVAEHPPAVAFPWHRDGVESDVTPTLTALGQEEGGKPPAVAYGLNTNRVTGSHGNPGGVLQSSGVRRLLPVECERLQSFPDGWSDLGGTPDSRRYAALGDAVTVNVAEWIGGRLAAAVRPPS